MLVIIYSYDSDYNHPDTLFAFLTSVKYQIHLNNYTNRIDV